MTLPKQGIKQTKSLTYSTAKHYAYPFYRKVYQPITSKCQPISRSYDILCHNSPKATGISIRWLASYYCDGADETVNCKICSCLSRNWKI